jgi:hypothetical protein
MSRSYGVDAVARPRLHAKDEFRVTLAGKQSRVENAYLDLMEYLEKHGGSVSSESPMPSDYT